MKNQKLKSQKLVFYHHVSAEFISNDDLIYFSPLELREKLLKKEE